MQKTVSLVLVCGIQDYVRTNVKFLFLLVYCLLVLSTYDSVIAKYLFVRSPKRIDNAVSTSFSF